MQGLAYIIKIRIPNFEMETINCWKLGYPKQLPSLYIAHQQCDFFEFEYKIISLFRKLHALTATMRSSRGRQ